MDRHSTYRLLERCRKGDRNAQLALYELHAGRLYAACLRIIGRPSEAEEAVQDAFLKIFTRLGRYREDICFEAWMRRIAVHTAIDYVRRQTAGTELISDDYAAEAEPEPEPESDEEAAVGSVSQVKAAMQRLPAGYRLVLSLYLFEGYDMEEIASILQVRPVTVRTQYLRAKKRLLELLTAVRHG